jgi:anti-sigma B factor antagonist
MIRSAVHVLPAWAGQLKIEDFVRENRHTLRLSGELDLASAAGLEEALLQLRGDATQAITLDLSKLEFMDSTGLYAIVSARGLCQEQGYEFSLIQGPPSVRRMFEVTGLIDSLPFQPDIVRPDRADPERGSKVEPLARPG